MYLHGNYFGSVSTHCYILLTNVKHERSTRFKQKTANHSESVFYLISSQALLNVIVVVINIERTMSVYSIPERIINIKELKVLSNQISHASMVNMKCKKTTFYGLFFVSMN